MEASHTVRKDGHTEQRFVKMERRLVKVAHLGAAGR